MGLGFGFNLYGFGSVPYGSLNLTDSSPAQVFVEPITLSEIATYLKIDDPAPEDSATLELRGMIAAARAQAEILQGCDLIRKSWDLTMDYFQWQIKLRHPLVSVDAVRFTDSSNTQTVVSPATYMIDRAKRPGVVMPVYGKQWPSFMGSPSSAVLVQFTSGYLPTDQFWLGPGSLVKNGMKLLISHWYNKRLPFERGVAATNEYPYAVTACLSAGALNEVS